MIYGSVCSGIEAATVAWHPLGWRPAFFSETEPFPRAVLAHHYPEVPLHGDFTTIKTGQFAAIDVLVGGTPCQSFSISGLRGGLGDDRGNLALEYLRLADRLRPRWVVWENVPGVLSTNDGRDFGAILGGMGELGYGFAWRVLDAQFVRVDGFRRAVPQRRRRVFLVGCARGWPGAAAVLFERSSLSWDSAPRRQSRQEPAADAAAGVARDGIPDASHALNGHGTTGRHDAQGETFIPECFNIHPRNNAPGIVDATPTDVATGINAGLDKVSERGVRILASWRVRRLMPVECERLQGFPDGYTAVPYRGHVAADGPRYKALGNSMAVNVMRWIGSRIGMVDQIVESRQTRAACVQQDVLQRIAL